MKKVLMVPFFAVGVLVSQGWAEQCKSGGSQLFCQYATGCYELSTDYSDGEGCKAPDCSCSQVVANCVDGGSVYTGVTGLNAGNDYGKDVNCATNGGTWTGEGKNPNRESRGWCNWGPCDCHPTNDYSCSDGGCFEIEDEKQESDCNDKLTSKGQCPTASLPRADGGSCGGSPIKPAQQLETSQFSLTVIPQAGSLLVSSQRDATLSLFNMSGKQVFSQNVPAGYSGTISLNGQKLGVYYAVVSSGSSKQTVKVVLK